MSSVLECVPRGKEHVWAHRNSLSSTEVKFLVQVQIPSRKTQVVGVQWVPDLNSFGSDWAVQRKTRRRRQRLLEEIDQFESKIRRDVTVHDLHINRKWVLTSSQASARTIWGRGFYVGKRVESCCGGKSISNHGMNSWDAILG